MPSTFTSNLILEKPATGEQAGTWGNTANTDYDFIDTAIDGNLNIQLAAAAYDLQTLQQAVSEGRNKVIVFTGALTQDATITIKPNTVQKIYYVLNQTTGGHNLIFTQGSGTTFTLQNGHSAIIYATGTGASAAVSGVIANLQVDNLLVVTSLVIAGSTTFQQAANFTQPTTFSTATFNGMATFNAGLTINLGSDQPYDLYYRSPGGGLARLAPGSSGMALTAGSGGVPQWATVSMTIGGPIVGSVANCVLFVNPSGQMAQDGNFRYVSGAGLGVGVSNPTHPLHVGGALTADLWLDNADSTTPHRVLCAVNGARRGLFGLDAMAEGGGNTGSNPVIGSWNDPGSTQTIHMSCWRNTSHTTLGGYTDLGGRVNVYCPTAEAALVVRGGGGNLQVWQDAGGNQLAYIDASGVGHFAGGGAQYLSLTNDRLDLWGSIAGHPLGTIHIGPEPVGQTTSLCGTIVMEPAVGFLDGVPANMIRMYYRHNTFTIQFYYNGTQYYASLGLQGQQGTASWTITSIPA